MLRLGLNVASTQVVLSEGHNGPDAAGKVIEAFGEFVISGNYAVGIFVFIILIIINLVVVTAVLRVSEVSARFTLDAMPGKQMAIVRSGLPAFCRMRKPRPAGRKCQGSGFLWRDGWCLEIRQGRCGCLYPHSCHQYCRRVDHWSDPA